LRALTARNLQFASDQRLRVVHRIDACELQNQQAFVRPEFFDLQRATAVVGRERGQPQSNLEPVGNVAVQLDRDFAVASLRLPHAGQGNEFAADS
jgi:hypothetical protein